MSHLPPPTTSRIGNFARRFHIRPIPLAIFDWRLIVVLLAALFMATQVRAETLGMVSISTSSGPLAGSQDVDDWTLNTESIDESISEIIDEIIVVSPRERAKSLDEQRFLNEELLQRILRDFEQYQELEHEFDGQLEAIELELSRLPLQIGYDLRDQSREPVRNEALMLPLDFVMPAVVISMDF